MTQTIVTQLEATNLHIGTTIDPRRGIRVDCWQDLDEVADGPTVSVEHPGDWQVTIRCADGERIRVTVDADGKPTVAIAGDVPTFRDLFDDEADLWDDD
ncbi:MAG TPA: hypothetical protein VH120_10285 [Gemmataceae bacterium]|jgi:hypothetical protein|nr:hypothetical protein [Gemmataceae bacterium]